MGNNSEKKKGLRGWKLVLLIIACIGVGSAFAGGSDDTNTKTKEVEKEDTDTKSAPENESNENDEGGTTATEEPVKESEPDVSTEYKNALKQAENYSKTLHMSNKGIYDQLTSEYGGKFPEEAAQYAIDNMTADFKQNALEQAKNYQETLSMSKQAVYDQLTSEYGGQFTAEEAQYAIDNLQ